MGATRKCQPVNHAGGTKEHAMSLFWVALGLICVLFALYFFKKTIK